MRSGKPRRALQPGGDLGRYQTPPNLQSARPEGFTTEFLRACWGIVRQDFLDVFQRLFELRGRGFCRLNQAILALLPKRADASQLRDYRPICLIHLVAKIDQEKN